jgi:hypothetical protein
LRIAHIFREKKRINELTFLLSLIPP